MVTKATCSVLDLDPIQSLNMNGNRIEGLGSPVVATDAANKDYVDINALPVIGGTMLGSINMGSNSIFNLVDPINPQDAATKNYVDTAGGALEGYLNDPTVTRTSPDSFSVGRFQASPLTSLTPLVRTISTTSRQLTNIFLRSNAGLNGIAEAQGAFAVPAETSQIDIGFSTGPNRITAASGSSFSVFSAGDKVIVDGSTSNDGTYDVSAATGTTIDTVQGLIVEAAGASVSIYRVAKNETYHMFAVEETGVGTVDIAIDISVSGSNIGAFQSVGWEAVRRLWSFVLNSSSDIEDFNKKGNFCEWVSPVLDFSTSSTALQNPQLRVPTGFVVTAKVHVQAALFIPFVNGLRGTVAVSSGQLSTGILATISGGQAGINPENTINTTGVNAANAFRNDAIIDVTTDTGGLVWSDSTHNGTSFTYGLNTLGYIDERID